MFWLQRNYDGTFWKINMTDKLTEHIHYTYSILLRYYINISFWFILQGKFSNMINQWVRGGYKYSFFNTKFLFFFMNFPFITVPLRVTSINIRFPQLRLLYWLVPVQCRSPVALSWWKSSHCCWGKSFSALLDPEQFWISSSTIAGLLSCALQGGGALNVTEHYWTPSEYLFHRDNTCNTIYIEDI